MIAIINHTNNTSEPLEVVFVSITPSIIRLHLKDGKEDRTFFCRERPKEYGGNFWFEFETNSFVKDISICPR
jgi:hypothetical protein